MEVKRLLYLIRTEADFERVVCLAIAGKGRYEQYFVFVGDFSPFYRDGIQDQFQKDLFLEHNFTIKDFCDYDFLCRLLKKLSNNSSITFTDFRNNTKLLVPYLFHIVFKRYINLRKRGLITEILHEIKPNVLLTDQSITNNDYLPQMFRKEAIRKGIPVFLFAHGAANGLHKPFSNPSYEAYEGSTVIACSKNETNSEFTNRIILGDISSSYPYVHYLNNLKLHEIHFLDNRKYKIAFLVGGTGPFTSTTGWYIQEEIIIELSENKDVAMILKLHPREAPFIDLRMLRKFENLMIVGKECDRSRVTKWADIVVCSDHCSTIFEPMILGKRVVAIGGKHIPKYRNNDSPLKSSSVKHISSAREFDLNSIPNANPQDSVTNTICWGNNGHVDLAKLLLEKIDIMPDTQSSATFSYDIE